MKIFVVRGMNLASLVGPFCVEFDKAPLERAGLFAITGPTAAGKSTLLDAICLALFDEVPRLRAAPKHRVGRDAGGVGANDVRSLLSRGTAEASAEVEFLGRDGHRYCARWYVRRANLKPDGNLQAQVVTLTDAVTGRPVAGSGTKTERLATIHKLVGLSFEQFCRSALLAQGDFAAFLRAGADERAALLEQMTGTELYSALSRRAHERAAAEKKSLEDLALKQETVEVLPEADRARVHAERDAEVQRVAAAEAAQATAAAARSWHTTRAERAGLADQAREDLAFAEETQAASASDARELALVESAQPLRPLVEAETAGRLAVRDAAAKLEAAQRDLERAHDTVAAKRTIEVAAGAAADVAGAALVAAKPDLVVAHELEVELATVGRDLAQAKTEADRAAEEAVTASDCAAQKAEALLRARAASRDAAAWLEAHAHDAALADEWPRWRAELERAAKASGELLALAQRRLTLERAARDLSGKREAADAKAATATVEVETREAEVQTARAAMDAAGASAPRENRVSLLEERTRLQALERAAGDALSAREEEQRQRQSATGARTLADEASRRGAEARARRSALEAKRSEEGRNLERARATRELAARRADLVDGEPCPLCGAHEHPYASAVPHLDAMLRDLEERVAALESDAARALKDQTTAEATEGEQSRRAADADKAAVAAETVRLRHEARWREVRAQAASTIQESPFAEGALAELQGLLVEFAGRVDAAALAEATLTRLAKAEKAASELLDQARKALAKAERERAALETEATTAMSAVTAAEAERARLAGEEQAALAAAAPAFAAAPTFADALRRDAASFLADCKRRVEERRARQQSRAEAERLLADLGPEVAAAEERAVARGAASKAAAERRDALAGRQVDLAKRRAALFGGRAAEEVERTLQANVAKANTTLTAARTATSQAESEVAANVATVAALTQVRNDRARASDVATGALKQALSERCWAREQLDAWLAYADTWRRSRRERLAELDRAVTHARSVLSEREAQLAAHERTGPPRLTEAEAEEALTTAAGVLATAKVALEARTFTLHKDDEARARRAALDAEAGDRSKAADVYLRLGALIGSADGKKLRVFAQGLTFEALLKHANQHLKLLRPRYRLERVPGDDLNFQVIDLEQGEDIRSVNGLSGGETFLVSLALALGLSSLSSKDTRVESLFIDEGFGTLDPDTLDAALDALDALQATGQKVGVISHVPGLAEHIGVQVNVVKLGNGKSRIEVAGVPRPAPTPANEPQPPKTRRGRPRRTAAPVAPADPT